MSKEWDETSKHGYFGDFGGRFAPEILTSALDELEREYKKLKKDKRFQKSVQYYLKNYVGRPTRLMFAENLTRIWGGAKIWLKREDLLHTGAHKINNTIGQALMAKAMGKTRIIAETGAGQHGVATATVGSMFGFETVIYMGEEDLRRQNLNGVKMKLLGARIVGVSTGKATLKEACSEAMRDWALNVAHTHYIVGSVFGPHPFPTIVRDFHKVIGEEVRDQFMKKHGKLPDALIACVGGGSNAIGLFYPFLEDKNVKMYGVEAGGNGNSPGMNSAAIQFGKVGFLHGTKTLVIQDDQGQVLPAHSVSAGLDYPAVGPEHAHLAATGRVKYLSVMDDEALSAFLELSHTEGIIPALETAHVFPVAKKLAKEMGKKADIVINLSGRGDKDAFEVYRLLGDKNK